MIPLENQRGRSWIFVVLALLLASATAMAGTTGNLTGYVVGPDGAPLPGVTVTVVAPVLQGSRTVTTDSQGFYRVTQLPPGDNYDARFESTGYKPTVRSGIVIHIDETIKLPTVKMQTVQVEEEIEVVEVAPVIDQGSTTIGRNLTNEFLDAVPTARTTNGVLTLAPGSASDSYGVSFRGATSPENHYVIDGLNTTGVMYGTASSSLPIEFIQEVQVKTGGYEPEYGRATGGQSIVITKSGGNEFHGDFFLYSTPIEGERSTVVIGEDYPGTAHEEASYIAQSKLIHSTQIGFDLGGYIIKDRLWFFVGYAPSLYQRDYGYEFRLPSTFTAEEQEKLANNINPEVALTDKAIWDKYQSLSHYYMAKFTLNISQDHSVWVSFSGSPGTGWGYLGGHNGLPSSFMGTIEAGAMDYILSYNGKFLGGIINLDTILGYHTEYGRTIPFNGTYQSASGNSPYDGQDFNGDTYLYYHSNYDFAAPGFTCTTTDGEEVPCYRYGFMTGGYGFVEDTNATRLTFKPILSIYLNNLVGNHVIKFGGDYERNHVDNTKRYTGGFYTVDRGSYHYERYYSLANVPQERLQTDTFTHNTSAFAQDNWSLLSNLTLSLGVRWERQELQDINGVTRMLIDDNIAPRIGVIYDPTKQGKSRIIANYGRYYSSIPQDLNDRAMVPEGFLYFRFYDDEYPNYQPGTYDLPPEEAWLNFGQEQAYIQKDLKGMYSDELLLGFDYEVMKDIGVGVTAVQRKLGNIIEDISPDDGNTYLVANPGADNMQFYGVDPDNPEAESQLVTDENGEAVTFRRCFAGMDPLSQAPVTYCFPKATRTYRALEFTFDKRFSDNWQAQASYTLSRTWGNYPGLFTESNLQLDPNITSMYDVASALANRDGLLEQDRTHNFKLAGAYLFNFGTSLGLTAYVYSGTPIAFLGYNAAYFGPETFILPRMATPEKHSDGTSYDVATRTPWIYYVNASVHHRFRFANKHSLNVGFVVANVLNAQGATRVDQTYTYQFATPYSGGNSLQDVMCYDDSFWIYTSHCERNPNFGNPVSYQSPFSVRFEAKYTF